MKHSLGFWIIFMIMIKFLKYIVKDVIIKSNLFLVINILVCLY